MATWSDLQLFKRIVQYKMMDECIANSVIRALNCHLWYLSAEMVLLVLFSQHVPESECKGLADALLTIKPASNLQAPLNRFGAGWGKPKFPSAVINATTRLCDFDGEDCCFMIYHLQLNVSFLPLPVIKWQSNEAYKANLVNIGAVNVVNDGVKRGVKLASAFVDTARDDKHFQNVLQVVEEDRKAVSDTSIH